MAATVGSISIDLSTNAAKFATGFKSAATTVETQSSRMAKSISAIERNTTLAAGTLKNFGTGLAAGAGLAAITSLSGAFDKLKETIAEYDEIATNAKTTGLKSDTYQALAFAAKQANISQESYNSALNIFAKNAGLASQGQGALYSGLKKLNPELLQNILNTKDQEERLKLVADAMAQTSDATQKAALSAAIFGKGGVEISRILENGRASIDKFKKTAKDLGIIVPDDLLQKAGELDDKLDVLSTVISRQLGEALINLAPALLGATTGFADFTRELNKTAADINAFVQNPSIATFAKLFGKGGIQDVLNKFVGDTPSQAMMGVLKEIQDVEAELAQLKEQGEQGFSVGIQTEMANQKLDELKIKLVELSKAARADLAEAFRASENASMSALAAMKQAASSNLPNVTRYGGDPNKITLPDQRFNYQSNANNTGVNVTRFGGTGSSATDQSLDDTADNTEQTAGNVKTLDRNTKSYIQNLSSDIGSYSAQTNLVINKLSDVTAEAYAALPSSILAALAVKNDSGSAGSSSGGYLFGDAWDSRYGSYISSRGIQTRPNIGHLQFPTTSDDGTYDTSVNVQQPGTNITLNYTAAKGESQQTAEQNARAMYDELVRAASRA